MEVKSSKNKVSMVRCRWKRKKKMRRRSWRKRTKKKVATLNSQVGKEQKPRNKADEMEVVMVVEEEAEK